jgi:hypothetical protein
MPAENRKLHGRRPRYPSTGRKVVHVQIERAAGQTPAAVHAELENLSRDGLQLRTSCALESKEAITVRIRVEETSIDLTVCGVVRWQRRDGDGWLVGCRADQAIDWEPLGELFLDEVLATEEG